MKKLLLTCIVAMSIFGVEAQTKSKAKSAKVTSEQKAKNEYAKKEKERQEMFKMQREERLFNDSLRKEEERLARDTFEMQRAEWTAKKLQEIDSTNQETWKRQSIETEQAFISRQNQEKLSKAAKLSDYQSTQVVFINQTYSDKAREIKADSVATDEEKKTRLVALNEERKDRIKTVVGKSKAKKIAKELKNLEAKNGTDPELAWVAEAEAFVKN